MAIVIKKRVSLEFLGEEYKDSYLTFKSLPISKFKEFQSKLPKVDPRFAELVGKIDKDEATPEEHQEFINLKEKTEGSEVNNIDIMLELLQDCFVKGEFANEGKLEPVTKEDLVDIDAEVAKACFDALTGNLSPKV